MLVFCKKILAWLTLFLLFQTGFSQTIAKDNFLIDLRRGVSFEVSPYTGAMGKSGIFGLRLSMNYSSLNLEFAGEQVIGRTANLYPLALNFLLNLSSSLKSKVLDSVAGFQIFDSEKLQTCEFLLATDAQPSGSLPFFLVVIAGVNQGWRSQFDYLPGMGKHIQWNDFRNTNRIGLRYHIRDQIFRQKINNESLCLTT